MICEWHPCLSFIQVTVNKSPPPPPLQEGSCLDSSKSSDTWKAKQGPFSHLWFGAILKKEVGC